MKKQAKALKKGDIIIFGREELEVEEIEVSEIGKQGARKVRIVAKKKSGEKVVLIRPDDYPFEVREKKK
jgi:translation elongation factor P/translation initiation factor 5A